MFGGAQLVMCGIATFPLSSYILIGAGDVSFGGTPANYMRGARISIFPIFPVYLIHSL
ncbi:hypothetical protein BDZ94DRAFT_1257910 [Collybia nuda]|uniref:Uncharacterized protein n=1 Tax=Collybia nuda TaxID=64659 RepID=A0A9P6CJ52_9AGAR|nr:hypothetical protein BDZ94DRAFT_1257910 [Collybia nuda]